MVEQLSDHQLQYHQESPIDDNDSGMGSNISATTNRDIQFVVNEAKDQINTYLPEFEKEFLQQEENKQGKRKRVLDRALFNLTFINCLATNCPTLVEYFGRRDKTICLAKTGNPFFTDHRIEFGAKGLVYIMTVGDVYQKSTLLTPESIQALLDQGKCHRLIKKFANFEGIDIVRKISKQIR